MQKKLVQSSLALTAAAALGLGSAFVASPALADGPQKLDVQNDVQVQKALSDIEGVNAYGAKGGELNLGVEKKTAEMKDLEKKYDNVNFTEGIKELKAYAGNDVVGGAGYTVGKGSGSPSGVCSTGFSGWDGDGNPVVLTAGHCSKLMDPATAAITGDSTVNDTEQPSKAPANGSEKSALTGIGVLGKWGFTSFGESGQHELSEDPANAQSSDIDFAVINVDKSKYGVKNGVTDWKSADSDDLSKSLATEISKVGAHKDGKIQKSGRTTGLTDGDVDAEYNAKFEFANISGYWVHGFGVTSPGDKPFSQPGDSGGAVFQGQTAVGVISGGGPNDDGTQFGWVADLDHSLKQANVDFQLTDPNEEPPGDDDADADAGADAKDADADAGADAKDADADAGADAKDADADAGADAKDADADAGADAPDAPKAPVVEDQTVDEGGQITGKAEADAKVKLDWNPVAGPQAASKGSVTVTADAEGNFTTEAPSEAGEYAYTATATTDAGTSTKTEFTVTVEEAADEAEADAAADGDDANAAADGDDANAAADGDDANADSAANGYDADAGAAADAKNAESNADSDGSKDGEAPAEREISISPKEVAASDFVTKDKGVQIKVEGFEEGEKVSLEVVAGPKNVEGITLDETANKDGVAAFSIYGTNASDPSAYLGQYDVQVTGANDTDDEKALTGSFDVVADEDGNGGGSDDGGDGGSDLPRTGAELTGLAAGAGLLVVGGAAVVLTMRRSKKN